MTASTCTFKGCAAPPVVEARDGKDRTHVIRSCRDHCWWLLRQAMSPGRFVELVSVTVTCPVESGARS